MNNELNSLKNYKVELSEDKKNISEAINYTLEYNIKKANQNKIFFYLSSIVSIILNAAIPVIYQFNQLNIERTKLIVIIISTISAIITSISALFWLKDSWIRYRTCAETLKSECYKFNGKIGEYAGENSEREKIFIKTINDIWLGNVNKWEEIHSEKSDISSQEQNENEKRNEEPHQTIEP